MDLSDWQEVEIPVTIKHEGLTYRRVILPAPCPNCFTIPACNGSCLCDVQ